MLLLYPPLARTTEPPLGIARIAGVLKSLGIETLCADLCAEGIDYLLSLDSGATDSWGAGAERRKRLHAADLSSPRGYANPGRHARAVSDLNRALKAAAQSRVPGLDVSLANYQDSALSPTMRSDLLEAAGRFDSHLFFPLYERRIPELFARHDTDVVGVSVMYLSQALPAFALFGYLRARWPALRIVAGGGLFTSWIGQGLISPEETFGGMIDAILPGPGELSVPRYLGIDPGTADGRLATPVFTDFSGNRYFSPGIVLPYHFSTGCPWKRCTFCPERAEDNPFRAIPAATALAELRELVAIHNPTLFHFMDSEVPVSRMRALAETPVGADWYGFARFSPDLTDPAFCRALRSSGCRMLQLGLESGNQDVLDSLGKGISLAEVDTILRNLADSGISAFLYVLFGTPAENVESARDTLAFVEERSRLVDFINVAIFNMPISGEEAKTLPTAKFYEGDLSLYCDFEHPQGWGREKVRAFLAREFGRSPGIRKILARNPPTFTSNHAPFFIDGTRGNGVFAL